MNNDDDNKWWWRWCMMVLVVLCVGLLVAGVGCEVIREVVLDADGVPTGVEQVVVEGPGGDMVAVGHEVVERLAPLLPEPWNTLLTALAGGFTAVAGTWVFRNRKKK
jgi:ABC-type Fe3+ transport system permease subunit